MINWEKFDRNKLEKGKEYLFWFNDILTLFGSCDEYDKHIIFNVLDYTETEAQLKRDNLIPLYFTEINKP